MRSRSLVECEICSRDSRGRLQQDRSAVAEFKRIHPKPHDCKDCEVDHIVPLSKGGRNDQSNMQWLSREQHRDKTRQHLRP